MPACLLLPIQRLQTLTSVVNVMGCLGARQTSTDCMELDARGNLYCHSSKAAKLDHDTSYRSRCYWQQESSLPLPRPAHCGDWRQGRLSAKMQNRRTDTAACSLKVLPISAHRDSWIFVFKRPSLGGFCYV